MGLERRRYLRQEHAKQDKAQFILCEKGAAPNPKPRLVAVESLMDPIKKITCPFCLGLEAFRLFLVSGKKGISRSNAKCPMCGQGMRLGTLMQMQKWGPKQYAEFVAPYSTMGFWSKCKFQVWKRRLLIMGWTSEFWKRYHELRGESEEDKTESFTDYINRKGKEDAEEFAAREANKEERHTYVET